ncbi:SDR family oxidoreductase [Roseovarius spongiae]|uniref:SDR family oxidoreductase n=1 Tax=Roseovarius spongiae TaxID=2320272 RepID=A0A3A8AYS9_9RHOB|nr:SDR family oxidoreductase [Roseovarius spongiae]RKF17086.1 SDR family oxidoreductase [Roseovarius spongiae]
MTDESQRVAVVTGGLAGIGLSIARALAKDGLRVVVGARSGGSDAAQQKARDEIGPAARVYPLDVRDEASVAAFHDKLRLEVGEIDVLVNSAGVTAHQTISGHSLSDWHDVLETNLTGPFLTMRACLPGMIERGWGRIVNIASTAASSAVADHPAYCASKSGLLGLSRAAALEGAPHGVTCVTVSPTWVETEMLHQSAETMARASGRSAEDEIADLARANPQNRLVQPREIAALVAFLCSDAAPALTMEDISVNAGAHW